MLLNLNHPHQASSQLVLDYSGEHNISITTNPNGFFLLFPCYLLLRVCSLTLDITLPKIRSPLKGEAVTSANLARLTASPSEGRSWLEAWWGWHRFKSMRVVFLNKMLTFVTTKPDSEIWHLWNTLYICKTNSESKTKSNALSTRCRNA